MDFIILEWIEMDLTVVGWLDLDTVANLTPAN
jgi:hypothetical protein